MLLKLYRGIGPGSIIMALLSGVLVWLYPMINPLNPADLMGENPMPLYNFFATLLISSPKLAAFASFALVLLCAFYLANFNTRLFFITERTLLPASLYIILSGFFVSLQGFVASLPAALLLMLSVDRLLAAYRKSGIAYSFFDSALILSIGSLFYFNLIWFYPVIIIGLLLIRTVNLREIVLSVIGLITPYIVTYAILYISGKELYPFTELILKNIITVAEPYKWTPLIITLFSLASGILLFAFFHLASLFNKKKIRTRKTFSVLIWMLFFSVGIGLAVPSASIELNYIILIPWVFIVTHLIVFIREKKIANIVFAIILLSVAAIQVLRLYSF